MTLLFQLWQQRVLLAVDAVAVVVAADFVAVGSVVVATYCLLSLVVALAFLRGLFAATAAVQSSTNYPGMTFCRCSCCHLRSEC